MRQRGRGCCLSVNVSAGEGSTETVFQDEPGRAVRIGLGSNLATSGRKCLLPDIGSLAAAVRRGRAGRDNRKYGLELRGRPEQCGGDGGSGGGSGCLRCRFDIIDRSPSIRRHSIFPFKVSEVR